MKARLCQRVAKSYRALMTLASAISFLLVSLLSRRCRAQPL